MSRVYFISDLHLGHKSILKFSPERGGSNVDEHNEWIIDQWNSVVNKHDKVWVLGDVAFSVESLELVNRLKGYKNLVRGNHDRQSTSTYLKYFNHVYGLVKEYGFWLSHAPVHPQELRGKPNLHGHVHQNPVLDDRGIPDPRYLNVCVEPLSGLPISLEEVRSRLEPTHLEV